MLLDARQRADVDVDDDAVGNHVHLGAAVGDVRRERRVGAGVGLAGQGEVVEIAHRVVDAIGIGERLRQAGLQGQRLHVAAPGVEDARLRPILGQSLHDLGGGDERVVGFERP